VRGAIAFAVAGEDSRTTQLVIHTGNNDFLDHSGYVPFGRVVRGMDYIDQVYSKWGELPQEKRIVEEGNQYLYEKFPGLSYILNATPALE
jgi:peptidyl-prolyl cis-trans isomerase A (cyclophilin A)